jgi:hypothetical protein
LITSGLPDGLFSNRKIQILENFGGYQMEKCCYILCPFGIFYGHLAYICDHLVHIVSIWYIFSGFVVPRKIWEPWITCAEILTFYIKQHALLQRAKLFGIGRDVVDTIKVIFCHLSTLT